MKHILIVEDDGMLVTAYKAGFDQLQLSYDIAVDGEEALKKIEDHRPDLILLDIVLPKKDGLGVLEEIKKNPNLKDIPIVITSNLDQGTDIERGISLGAEDYIIKSDSSISQIITMVKKKLHL